LKASVKCPTAATSAKQINYSFKITLLAALIVLNMGTEMVYILEQRLKAQNIPADKSKKVCDGNRHTLRTKAHHISQVLNDVVKTMYSEKFLTELFKPQEVELGELRRCIRQANRGAAGVHESSHPSSV
jgi:hypothetical protein